nr:hypothetical protein [uncultured Cohaesibacter sp.]
MSYEHFLVAGIDASYQPVNGDAVDCSVILYSKPAEFGKFESKPDLDGIELEVLASECNPATGGVFTLMPETDPVSYKVMSKPRHTGIEKDIWRMVVDQI